MFTDSSLINNILRISRSITTRKTQTRLLMSSILYSTCLRSNFYLSSCFSLSFGRRDGNKFSSDGGVLISSLSVPSCSIGSIDLGYTAPSKFSLGHIWFSHSYQQKSFNMSTVMLSIRKDLPQSPRIVG